MIFFYIAFGGETVMRWNLSVALRRTNQIWATKFFLYSFNKGPSVARLRAAETHTTNNCESCRLNNFYAYISTKLFQKISTASRI